jgi:uncharacterized protein YaaQ
MADIFTKIANSPVAFGVIKGATDLFVAGRTAQKKEALAAKKKEIETAEKNQKSFVDVALSSQDMAQSVLTNPYFKDRRETLFTQNRDLYNAIALKSLAPKEVTPYNQQIIDMTSGNSTAARNFIADNKDYLAQNPTLARILKTSASVSTLTEGQNRIVNGVKNSTDANKLIDSYFPIKQTSEIFEGPLKVKIDGGRPVNVDTGEELKGDLIEYRDNNPTQSDLFYALSAKAKALDEEEFEGLSDANINTMETTIKNAEERNPGSGIVVANSMLERIDKRDGKSAFFLKSFILGYGEKENSKVSVPDLLSKSVDMVREDIKDQTSRALFAKNVLDSKKVQNMVSKGLFTQYLNSENEEEQQIAKDYFALKAMKDSLDKVAEGKGKAGISYGGVDLFPDTVANMAKNRETANIFLSRTNGLVIQRNGQNVDIEGFINSLPPQEKAAFLTDITSTMENHDNMVTAKKVTENGNSYQDRPDNYAIKFPNLYNIPEIKAFIHGPVINQPPEDVSVTRNVASTQTVDSTPVGNPLPDTQVLLADKTQIVTLSEDVVQFSKQRGFDKPSDMLKDDGYFETLQGAGGFTLAGNGTLLKGNDKIFKAANAIIKQVPQIKNFTPNSLRTRDYAAIGRTIVNQQIDDDADVFATVAMLMNDDFSIKKDPGKMGYAQEQIEAAVTKLSAGDLKVDDIAKQNVNLNDYTTTLNSAINNINVRGDAMNATTILENITEDIIKSETGLVIGTGSYIAENFGDVFNVGQRNLVVNSMNTALSTLSKDRRIANAKLASQLITIAYQRARSLDPNGRISDRDFKAALDSITSSFFASNQITKALLLDFKNEAESQLIINNNLLEVFTNIKEDGSNIILKKNIRAIRAVPVFRKVRQMNSSINAARQYRERFDENGNKYDRSIYALSIVQAHRPPDANLQVYEVVRATNKLDPIAIGLPIYTDKFGRMLTSQELKQRGFRP